jgi:methylated-DNA-[protein]-cysteine S-methyltransferase
MFGSTRIAVVCSIVGPRPNLRVRCRLGLGPALLSKPPEFRESPMFYSTTYQSPLCKLTLERDGENIVGLWMEGQKYHGGAVLDNTTKICDDIPVFKEAKTWLNRYFLRENPDITALPIKPMGGEFRQGVWEILCSIPYGEVTTYGEIAKKMAIKTNKPNMSSQAIGGAVGHNPIAIIIPCHRVIGSNGSLTGYAGGIAIKKTLLEFEGAFS